MEEFDGDYVAVAAAEILLSLSSRKLRLQERWPEWVPPPINLNGWMKHRRERSGIRRTPSATVWVRSLKRPGLGVGEPLPEHGAGEGPGVDSSSEEAAPSPPLVKVEANSELMAAPRSEAPVDNGAAVESRPSTSGGDLAPQRPCSSEKAHAKTASAQKETMEEASSPTTPLEYPAAAAGSGSSSSGDDVASSSGKRKAPAPAAAGGSGGASSGDEGSSSPAKRAHLAAAEAQAERSTLNRDDNGVLLFDLNDENVEAFYLPKEAC